VRRKHSRAKEEHDQIDFLRQRNAIGLYDGFCRFPPQLHRAAAPAVLLLSVGVVFSRNLVITRDIVQENKLPSS